MPAACSFQTILQRPDVWRGDQLASVDRGSLATGCAALDAELPGGGWPRGTLTELLAERAGIGELSLLLPALRRCAAEAPIVLVAPPQLAHAPAWAAQFPLGRLLLVEAAADDIAWSAEQVLTSAAAGALLAWLPPRLDNKVLRRLQLAAGQGPAPAFLFRLPAAIQGASPAVLRLRLNGSRQGLRVDILKRRGPACARPLFLSLERPAMLRPAVEKAPAAPHLAVLE